MNRPIAKVFDILRYTLESPERWSRRVWNYEWEQKGFQVFCQNFHFIFAFLSFCPERFDSFVPRRKRKSANSTSISELYLESSSKTFNKAIVSGSNGEENFFSSYFILPSLLLLLVDLPPLKFASLFDFVNCCGSLTVKKLSSFSEINKFESNVG